MVLRLPSSEAFLDAFGFEKPDPEEGESQKIEYPGQQAVKNNYGFDPAILILPEEETAESATKDSKKKKKSPKITKPKVDARGVVIKRTFAVTDAEGTLLPRGKNAKEEADKALATLVSANKDLRDLVFLRFSGDAILQTLSGLLLTLGWHLNEEDIPLPMNLSGIEKLTNGPQKLVLVSLQKWKPEEVEDQ